MSLRAVAASCATILACGGVIHDDLPDAAADATADIKTEQHVSIPPAPCPQGGGLQAGAPWPMLHRCPTRESRTNETVTSEPTIAWSVQTNGAAVVVAADGTVYSCGHSLTAVTSSGAIKWTSDFGTDWKQTLFAPMIIASGDVVAGVLAGGLVAVDPSGTTKWTFQPPCSPSPKSQLGCLGGYPTIADDGTIYTGVTNGDATTIYAVTSAGQIKWSYVPPPLALPASLGAFTIAYDGTIVFNYADELVALSPSGSPLWTWSNGQSDEAVGLPSIDADGTIYVVNLSVETLYAVSSSTGLELWELPIGLAATQVSPPAIGADKTVYIGGNEGLRAIHHGAQTTGWSFGLHGEILSSPSVAGDGSIDVGYTSGVGALDSTGSELWMLKTPEQFHPILSSVAIGANETLYAVDEQGILYAIGP